MNRFLINLSYFILVAGSVTVGLFLLSDLAIKQRKAQLLKISDEINIVFAGDSNVECAINDSLIANSINIAQSGESYLYSYIKIRSLLEYNNRIKTIFIGFSPGNLSRETEERWMFRDDFVIEKIKLYNYLMHYPEKILIIKQNPKAYLKGLTESVSGNLQTVIGSAFTRSHDGRIINFGGYEYLVRDKLQEALEMNLSTTPTVKFEKGQLQEKYLKMISDLCHQKSINLVLLNTPKYYRYDAINNEEERLNWLSCINSLPADSLLDLSALDLPDSCYGDLNHLNYRGAKVFSEFLNEKLHSGL